MSRIFSSAASVGAGTHRVNNDMDTVKSILVATDFSERSDRAVRRAVLLARQTGAALSLAHVVDDDQPRRIVESELDMASRLLKEQAKTLESVDGVSCRADVKLGDAFAGILAAAQEQKPDLLVVGPHRRQLLKDVFTGTTAERTIRNSAWPVLMANAPPVGPYRNVLLTSDLSDGALLAARHFAALDLAPQAGLSALHVFDAPALRLGMSHSMSREQKDRYLEGVRDEAVMGLADFVRLLNVGTVGELVRRETISPAHDILAAAHEADVGLVVVGSCGRNGIRKMVLGSVAEELLRIADVDVLVIPPAA